MPFERYSKVLYSAGLNAIGPHSLIGIDTIRKYGLVGVAMDLLEEMWHCVYGVCGLLCPGYCPLSQLDSYYLHDVGFSAPTPASPLPPCCHDLHHNGNGLNLWSDKPQPQVNIFLIRTATITVSLHSNSNLNWDILWK